MAGFAIVPYQGGALLRHVQKRSSVSVVGIELSIIRVVCSDGLFEAARNLRNTERDGQRGLGVWAVETGGLNVREI